MIAEAPPVPETAMIMAAGLGTRMMPLTADRPKPLIRVAGTSLIDHVLGHLRVAGIRRIVVNVHYRADQMRQHLAVHARDFDVTISDEGDLLRDTGGGLMQALPLIAGDPFLCVNADNWWSDGTENAIQQMARHWQAQAMDVLMLLVPRSRAGNHLGAGDFDMDADGRLSRRQAGTNADYVWTGIQMMARSLVCDPPSDVFSTNVFWDRAMMHGRCFGLVHQGDWFDVGYPEAISATEAALTDG